MKIAVEKIHLRRPLFYVILDHVKKRRLSAIAGILQTLNQTFNRLDDDQIRVERFCPIFW